MKRFGTSTFSKMYNFFILFTVERTYSDWRKRVGSSITKCHPQYSHQWMLRYIIHGTNLKNNLGVFFFAKYNNRHLYWGSLKAPQETPGAWKKNYFDFIRNRIMIYDCIKPLFYSFYDIGFAIFSFFFM